MARSISASHSTILTLAPFLSRSAFVSRSFQLLLRTQVLRTKRHTRLIKARAVGEWQEYEEAVKNKDLARALRFLKDVPAELDNSSVDSNRSVNNELAWLEMERDWEVLDTCLNADDLTLVGSAYAFLKNRGFLPNFGKYRNIVLEGPREVTPTVLKSSTGLEGKGLINAYFTLWMQKILHDSFKGFSSEISYYQTNEPAVQIKMITSRPLLIFGALCLISQSLVYITIFLHSAILFSVSKLSPKKWGVSGSSSILLIALLAGMSFLLNQGIDIRPNLAAILGLTVLDAIFLGGSSLAQISSYWPPYKRRILVHEAGHLLVAYLMGCPIRGVILDPIVAMQMGIQGQAGTQFWDEKLQNELAEGRVSGSTFDRYCMVLFAGIAAEALVYGEAEGGENDENLFRSISVLLEPPLSIMQMSNQARWSVLQSYNLLKWHRHAHRAAVKALENGDSLSIVIRRIEDAMSSKR